MDMRRFAAIQRNEEKAIGSYSEDSWHPSEFYYLPAGKADPEASLPILERANGILEPALPPDQLNYCSIRAFTW
jgi:hypothetical protein